MIIKPPKKPNVGSGGPKQVGNDLNLVEMEENELYGTGIGGLKQVGTDPNIVEMEENELYGT